MTKTLIPQGRQGLIDARRARMTAMQRRSQRKEIAIATALAAVLPMSSTYAYYGWADDPTIIFVLISLAMGIMLFPVGIFLFCEALKERRKEVFVISETGNDPAGMVQALDSVMDIMRNPQADQRQLVSAYENAVDRMQATIPTRPLSQLIAEGYHPSRPSKFKDGVGSYVLNHDDDPDADHWERASEALDKLRRLTLQDDPITTQKMVKCISDVVPPLRAVLRNRDVPTWRIERAPPKKMLTKAATTTHQVRIAHDDTPADAPVEAGRTINPMNEPDALSPVENRMNASATMTAMALRSLVTSFRSANSSLFHGTDLQTAETMLDEHLPRLVEAFLAADDASEGEARDAERANFARALGFMRDAIADIMERHAKNARDLLATESRFIEMRHGPGDPMLSA